MSERNEHNENGLRKALDKKIVNNISEVAELHAELRVGMRSLNEKIERCVGALEKKLDEALALQVKVEENSKAIVRIKTIGSLIAGGIAIAVSFLKDFIIGKK